MKQSTPEVLPNDQINLVVGLEQVRATDLPLVGGKAANLGELTAAGFQVPPGFCVTTVAFDAFMAVYPKQQSLLQRLATLSPADLESVRQLGAEVRSELHETPIPPPVAAAVVATWRALGDEYAYAVRSSATAEDQPDSSFAGQQDTYLNVRGEAALLASVRNCWASLFTDRAILYRLQRHVDNQNVRIAVVVQRMVEPQVAGILFTADPVTNQRHLLSIDASFGLGEALVSGLVSADLYQVDKRQMQIVKRQVADKQLQILASPTGGVRQEALTADQRQQAALSDEQILALARIGAKIEQHYGRPQDIEWAIRDEQMYVLQARPITTLYPMPAPPPSDDALHAYFSFGHFQMMTDPMPDLALSLIRMMIPIGRPADAYENPYIATAGGRIYADLSLLLRHRLVGRRFPYVIANADHLASQALIEFVQRPEFQARGEAASTLTLVRWLAATFGKALWHVFITNPDDITARGQQLMDTHIAQAAAQLAAAPTATARLKVVSRQLSTIFAAIVREWFPYVAAGLLAPGLLRRVLAKLAAQDQQVAADLLAVARGADGNVVNEMNLAVADLADLVRQSPALRQRLSQADVPVGQRLTEAATITGGPEFLAVWRAFLARYGMRAPGEIDLSRPRWHEDPTSLLQMVVSNAQHGEAGAQRAQTHQWIVEGEAAAVRLVAAARRGFWGWLRAPLVKRLTRATRQLLPTREHHKFWLVRLFGLIKPVFLAFGQQLVAEGRLAQVDDVWFLRFPELVELSERADGPPPGLIAERRAAFQRYQTLTPPRIITNTGEIPTANLAQTDAPPGVLLGSPVSAGVVEGIARVVLDPQQALVKPGEILVAPFTDPAWTPLFINAAGLVTEVGGYMTHGSVVAREYGIPAVVGVVDATKRIRNGQKISVDGVRGWVECKEE
ncbi:MAG: phosphoenolpyruvate synthase [Caldilinea sp. CFX5]|nr:phosphoenolpyruvate synthase [Caldilinea sp. CFX5]